MVSELQKLTGKVVSLENLSKTRNPLETDAAHTQRVAANAKRLKNENAALRDKVQDLAREGLISLQAQIETTSGLRQNAYAAEIRQAVRGMNTDQRNEMITNALKARDIAAVAAITEAPAMLSGVSPEYQDNIRESVYKMTAPELLADRDYTLEMISTSLHIIDLADNTANYAFSPAEVERIEQQVKAAEIARTDADKAFNTES